MNPNIKAAVNDCPNLSFKVNVGDRHRIMNSEIRKGSLWILPRRNDFRILVTGEVEGYLYHFLKIHFGTNIGEDQGRKYWYVPDLADLERIIRFFDSQKG